MTLFRLAVFAGIVVVLAVLAPKVVPDLIAGIAESPESETMPEPAAEPESPQAAVEEPAPRRRENLRQVALDADQRGHFIANARINGRTVEVMVDTGATIVAISAETARQLGIYLPKSAFNAPIRTANGTIAVAPVVLKEVRLGNVTVRNVEAAVSPDNVLGMNLLGMSFLSRLSKFEVNDGELVLTQ